MRCVCFLLLFKKKGCNVLYDLKDIRVYQQNIVKEITREVTIIRSLPINGVQ